MEKIIFLYNLSKIFLVTELCDVTKKNFDEICQKDDFFHFGVKLDFS